MLSEEQKGIVAQWFAAGAGLAEIQKRISEEFGIDLGRNMCCTHFRGIYKGV